MLPAEMALRPDITPYLPAGAAATARPRQTVRLADGDTLHLEAGLVRRTFKAGVTRCSRSTGSIPAR